MENQVDKIIQAVSNHYGITTDQIKEKTKKHISLIPRQVALFIMQTEFKVHPKEAGASVGIDRSTSIYTRKAMKVYIQHDYELRENVNAIIKTLEN